LCSFINGGPLTNALALRIFTQHLIELINRLGRLTPDISPGRMVNHILERLVETIVDELIEDSEAKMVMWELELIALESLPSLVKSFTDVLAKASHLGPEVGGLLVRIVLAHELLVDGFPRIERARKQCHEPSLCSILQCVRKAPHPELILAASPSTRHEVLSSIIGRAKYLMFGGGGGGNCSPYPAIDSVSGYGCGSSILSSTKRSIDGVSSTGARLRLPRINTNNNYTRERTNVKQGKAQAQTQIIDQKHEKLRETRKLTKVHKNREKHNKNEQPNSKLGVLLALPGNGAICLVKIGGQRITKLLDSDNGSSHNFMNAELSQKLNLPNMNIEPFEVRVANGERLQCTKSFRKVPIRFSGVTVKADLYALPLVGPDVVLGVQWLEGLGKVTTDYRTGIMEFNSEGRQVPLSTSTDQEAKEVGLKSIEK
ncbi:Unknown protein, partial [Striga hermonthica]